MQISPESKIAFIPAGAMNTMLALKAYGNGFKPTLWFYRQESYDYFKVTHRSPRLPNTDLPPEIRGTHDIEEVLDGASLVSFGSPSEHVFKTAELARPHIGIGTIILSVTKGFQYMEAGDEYLIPTEAILRVIPELDEDSIAAMSGPNFAEQAAKGAPSETTIASKRLETAEEVKRVFHTENFNVRIGKGLTPLEVEVMGAFKNVVGLIMGFAQTLPEYQENTGAFILRQGLTEGGQLCELLGGSRLAIMEPCGIGDYGLLMNSTTSRNVRAGIRFGRGEVTIQDLVNSDETIEGIPTAKAVRMLLGRHPTKLPMAWLTYCVIYRNMDRDRVVENLLSGKFR